MVQSTPKNQISPPQNGYTLTQIQNQNHTQTKSNSLTPFHLFNENDSNYKFFSELSTPSKNLDSLLNIFVNFFHFFFTFFSFFSS